MNKNNKKIIVTFIVLFSLIAIFLVIKFTDKLFSKYTEQNDESDINISFVFDYSCPWCSVWMEEVYPEVNSLQNDYNIDFTIQSLAILNDDSLTLAKIDDNVKTHYPDDYIEYLSKVLSDLLHEEDLDLDHYIKETIAQFGFDQETVLQEPDTDINRLTSELVEDLNIESVPTVIVNDKKVTDPFDLKEIVEKLNK